MSCRRWGLGRKDLESSRPFALLWKPDPPGRYRCDKHHRHLQDPVRGHVAVAAGSSTRPRIPNDALGTPVHGSAVSTPAHGTHCVPLASPTCRHFCRPNCRHHTGGKCKLEGSRPWFMRRMRYVAGTQVKGSEGVQPTLNPLTQVRILAQAAKCCTNPTRGRFWGCGGPAPSGQPFSLNLRPRSPTVRSRANVITGTP